MADNNTIEIMIRFGMDRANAVKAAQEMENLKAKSKEANTEGGKAADEHGKKLGKLHQAVELVGRQFGEVGHLVKYAFGSAAALAIAGAALALGAMIEKFRKLHEEAKKAREETAAVTVAVWEAARTGAKEAEESARKYIKAISDTGGAMDDLKAREDLEKAILDERIAQWEKLLELMGKAKPEASIKDAASLSLAKAQQERRRAEQPGLEQDAFEAERRKQAAIRDTGASSEAAAQLQNLKASQTDLVSKMLAAQNSNTLVNAGLGGKTTAEMQAFVQQRAGQLGISVGQFMQGDLGQAIGRYQAAAGAVSQNQSEIAKREAIIAAHENTVRTATEAADAAAKRRDTNAAAIYTGANSIARGEAVLGEKERGERMGRLFSPGGEAEQVGSIIGNARGALAARGRGQSLSGDQQSSIAALEQLLRDLGWGNQAIRNTLTALVATQEQQHAYVEAIEKRVRDLNNKINRVPLGP